MPLKPGETAYVRHYVMKILPTRKTRTLYNISRTNGRLLTQSYEKNVRKKKGKCLQCQRTGIISSMWHQRVYAPHVGRVVLALKCSTKQRRRYVDVSIYIVFNPMRAGCWWPFGMDNNKPVKIMLTGSKAKKT